MLSLLCRRGEREGLKRQKKNDVAICFFFFWLIGLILQWPYYIGALSFCGKKFWTLFKKKWALSFKKNFKALLNFFF
jgi:hypothetical protein